MENAEDFEIINRMEVDDGPLESTRMDYLDDLHSNGTDATNPFFHNFPQMSYMQMTEYGMFFKINHEFCTSKKL